MTKGFLHTVLSTKLNLFLLFLHFTFFGFTFFGSTGSLLAQGEECRLDKSGLQPIIERYNPFFGDHQWNARSRIEMARIDQYRLLIITQDGCKRHHIRFTLLLDPSIVKDETDFWVEEVTAMLHKVYYEKPEYNRFRDPFAEEFREKVQSYGINRRFNFPLNTQNFIGELLVDPTKGARITIEMINYIFKEEVATRRQGIPAELDDGWEKNDKK
jgi:hypothetical protein